jgi:hypothetical protein
MGWYFSQSYDTVFLLAKLSATNGFTRWSAIRLEVCRRLIIFQLLPLGFAEYPVMRVIMAAVTIAVMKNCFTLL